MLGSLMLFNEAVMKRGCIDFEGHGYQFIRNQDRMNRHIEGTDATWNGTETDPFHEPVEIVGWY